MNYELVKNAHMLFVVALIIGMVINGLLLLSLRSGTPQADRTIALAKRLNGSLMGIILGLVWILGLTLAYLGHWFGDAWLWAKLVMVVAVSALHGMQSGAFRKMLQSPGSRASGFMRASGLVVIVLAIIIVYLVIVKPF